jgi:hypothetical protein
LVGIFAMRDLTDTFARLSALPMFEAEPPATQDQISAIESQLGVRLPEQYVAFLRRYGYAGWFGYEVLGVRPIDPTTGAPSTVTHDCVSATKEARDPTNPLGTTHLGHDHVAISTDGGGGYFVLFAAGSPLAGQVHYYNFEDAAEPLQVWQDFAAFLEYIIEKPSD